MSKITNIELWNKRYGNREKVYDYAGRKMLKSACGNPNSTYQPTIDHIRPLSKGGQDIVDNIELCNRRTNEEKGDKFPTWKANGGIFQAHSIPGKPNGYKIIKIKGGKKDE